jgi:hypothetical protein
MKINIFLALLFLSFSLFGEGTSPLDTAVNNKNCAESFRLIFDPLESILAKYDLTPRVDTGQPIFFGQKGVSPGFFIGGLFKDADINVIANKIISGELKASDVPVHFIWVNGKKIAINNRSLVALSKAGVKPVVTIDLSGKLPKEGRDSLFNVLQRLEEMDGKPTDTIPIRKTGDRNSGPREFVTLPK